MLLEREEADVDGNRKLFWPLFKPVSIASKDSHLGVKEMSPEQTLIEFICTSASLHGVNRQSVRQLEWDILKVFPYNIMPANAAAWYMAKRKFYANQPQDCQLLPFLLKKYPDKFKVHGYQVEFLEKYNRQTARHKLNYLVHFGLHAYFSHKVDEYGVYFFDPNYYEKTDPFHSSLELCSRGRRVNMLGHYFGWNEGFIYQQHSGNLASLTRGSKVKVSTNAVGVIISLAKNGQYGFLKFGSGDRAIFCTKALYKDGYQYTGDPLRLPAVYFDAYQIPNGVKVGDGYCNWFAVAVWTGKKPGPKGYCSLADFRLTPTALTEDGSRQLVSEAGRKMRQPSSTMMIGQVVEIRKNGAVVSVRDEGTEKVFIPGWSKQRQNNSPVLTTLTGDNIKMRDLIAYYLDTSINVPGFTSVGKNVMILKEHEEFESKRRRRSNASLSLSEGAKYDTETGLSSEYEDCDSDEVSDGELEWLQKDVDDLIANEKSSDMVTFLVKTRTELAEVRAAAAAKKSPGSGRERKDSGLGSKPTTPTPVHLAPLQSKNIPKPEISAFARTKAALEKINENYRSSDDEDYATGDEISVLDERGPVSSTRRSRLISSTSATSSAFTRNSSAPRRDREVIEVPAVRQPYWVQAISMPEEFDEETEKMVVVDKGYHEERDRDYELPLGCRITSTQVNDGFATHQMEEWSDDEYEEDEGEEKDEEAKAAEKQKAQEELEAELKLLLEEADQTIPQDLLDGKHRPSEKTEDAEKIDDAEKTDAAEVKKEDSESAEVEAKDSSADETNEQSGSKKFRERRGWLEPLYVRFILALQDDEAFADDTEEPEYVPLSIITDPDLDYDEFDPNEVIDAEEIKGLEEDLKQDIGTFGSYVPIWVPIQSVQEKTEVARMLAEERRKAAAAAKEAATARTAAREAAKAAREAAAKEGGEKEAEKAEKETAEAGAAPIVVEVKVEAIPETKGSPKKVPKSPKKSSEPGSPTKPASPQKSPKKTTA